MPMRGELPIRPVLPYERSAAPKLILSRILAAIADLEIIAWFCTIGLLVTIVFVHSFPNFQDMVQALDQFP